jgi:hypothetical protein
LVVRLRRIDIGLRQNDVMTIDALIRNIEIIDRIWVVAAALVVGYARHVNF